MNEIVPRSSGFIVTQINDQAQQTSYDWLHYFNPQAALTDFINYIETFPSSRNPERHTMRAYLCSLADFCRHLGAHVVHYKGEDYSWDFDTMQMPTKSAVLDYMAYCKRQGRGSATIIRYMAAVRIWLHALQDQPKNVQNGTDFVFLWQATQDLNAAINTHNPASDVTSHVSALDQTGTRLTTDQIEKVFNYFQNGELDTLAGLRDVALVYLGIVSALRASELARVTLGNISKTESCWEIRVRGKRNNYDPVEIDQLAYDLIQQWVSAWNGQLADDDPRRITNETPIFQPLLRGSSIPAVGSKMGGVVYDPMNGLVARSILDIVKRRSLAALEFAIGAHDMRRTCAALMRRYGFDWEETQRKLRHMSIRTTQLYVGVHIESGKTLLTNKMQIGSSKLLVNRLVVAS